MRPQKAYSAATVIKAQRRVLKMAGDTIGRMSDRERKTLRACGTGGMATLDEVHQHIVAAVNLKVKK